MLIVIVCIVGATLAHEKSTISKAPILSKLPTEQASSAVRAYRMTMMTTAAEALESEPLDGAVRPAEAALRQSAPRGPSGRTDCTRKPEVSGTRARRHYMGMYSPGAIAPAE
jgi:hypothetical protein